MDNRTEKQKSIDKKHNDLRYKQKQSALRYNNINMFSKIGSLVIGILLLALLIRYTQNQFEPILPTFTSLLEKFSSSEVASVPFLNTNSIFISDWGVLEFLKVLFEGLLSLINVLLFFVNGIISVISYIVWFMQWLFIG